MCVCVCVCVHVNTQSMKEEDIQRIILFIIELLAKALCFSLYIKLSSRQ